MTIETPGVSIVIPACNEEATLPEFLRSLQGLTGLNEILVINDGSSDRTAAVAEAAGARVISHRRRKGNGAAVKTGLLQAVSEIVLIADADGQHTREDLQLLLTASPDYDLVIGARPFSWWHLRDFGNLILSGLAGILTGIPVDDLTSGLRRLRRRMALQFFHLYPEGFSFPTTSLLLFATASYEVHFLPIPNRPRPLHASPSKLRPFSEGFRFLSMMYRIILLSYPLRFFATVGAVCILLSFLWTLHTYRMTAQVSVVGGLLFMMGLTLLLFGTIADQLAQIRKTLAKPKE